MKNSREVLAILAVLILSIASAAFAGRRAVEEFCPPMIASGPDQNVFITYSSATCHDGVPCQAAEQIAFSALTGPSYNFACSAHEFTWNFGDGTTSSSGQSVTHVYTAVGTYTVTLRISNGVQQVTVNATVVVIAASECNGLMVPNQNVFITYSGGFSGCSAVANIDCAAREIVSFQAGSFGYSFTCAAHTFAWNFGDGSTASGPNVNHSFATIGTYPVTLTIANASQTVMMTNSVKVSTGVSVGIWDFTVQPIIVNGAAVEHGFLFHAIPSQVQQWQWDFGDGTIVIGEATQSHVYADGAALHTVTLTVPGLEGSVSHVIGTTKRRAAKH